LKKRLVFPPDAAIIVGDKKITLSFINQNNINKKEYKKHIFKIFEIISSLDEKKDNETSIKRQSMTNVPSLIAIIPYSLKPITSLQEL